MFVPCVGKNGDTNQEQKKGLNTILPSQTVLLLINRVLQLIEPTKVFIVQLLQVRNIETWSQEDLHQTWKIEVSTKSRIVSQ